MEYLVQSRTLDIGNVQSLVKSVTWLSLSHGTAQTFAYDYRVSLRRTFRPISVSLTIFITQQFGFQMRRVKPSGLLEF